MRGKSGRAASSNALLRCSISRFPNCAAPGKKGAHAFRSGLELPAGGERWEGHIAPAPELDPTFDRIVKVAAYAAW